MTDRKTMGRSRTQRLRTAIDALPRHARAAMLEGLRHDTIIAGAYVGTGAGVCPMVAVHRRGVRTDANRFARAWDQFCGVAQGQSRQASEREIVTLEAMLQASLLADERIDLAAAMNEHRALARERRAREAAQVGTSWLDRPVSLSPSGSPRRAATPAARRAAPRDGAPALAMR